MGGSKKNRRKNPANDSGVDLLSLAFNLPTRRDIERADREAAQHQIHTQSIKIQYDPGEDEFSDTESSAVLQDAGKPNTQEADETPKTQKSPKSPHHPQATQPKSILQLPSLKDRPKKVDQERLPTRRASKRESSKPPKARERSSSSPASIRVSSPSSSIPSSATFPGATSKHSQRAANIAPSDASTRPLQPDVGKEAHPQPFYQPLFAFPTLPMYPPAQYYSAVAKNNPTSDCNSFVPLSMYSRTSPPTYTHKSPQQPSLISQEVQHIQSKLDEVAMKLSKYPEDMALKGELSSLQTELNTRLNSLLGMEPPKESNASGASEPHNPKMKNSKSTNLQSQHITQREMSPERKIRHHLCTDCGKVRSSNYHNKHPIVPGGKPSTNYCEDCFEKNVENGVLKYHFCYGCGIARSKDFHQYHPISKGDRPFPNYCSVCIEEIRSAETIADVSMVNFAPSRSHENSTYPNIARGLPQSNKPIESLNLCQGSNSQGNQPHGLLFSAHQDDNKTGSREQKKIPQPLKLSTMGPQLSPSNSSPDSPYYPVRSTGASQRRAERSPLASPGSQYCSSPDTPTTPRYQSPYVEDVTSPVQEVSQQPEDYQHPSKIPHCDRQGDTSYPIATGKQKSQDKRRYHATRSPHSDISQEVSDDSIEGHASTDDSAHSTGSKTVKFRPKVDIRLSDSRTSSNASSHAKILEEDIKPDDDSVPSRVGIYGTSPVKSQNGYYARAQGSHNVSTSSFAGGDGYNDPILERSYRGAFSKDSPASSWKPPTSNMGGEHWYSKPTAYHSTTSPSMESFAGFRPGSHSTFNYGSSGGIGSEDGPPPFHTSRSAFSPSGPSSTAAFEGNRDGQESHKPSISPSSSSKAQPFPESASNSWKSYTSPYAGGQNAESSFRKASPWSNFPSRFDSECYTVQDDSSFSQSAFSDYSQPSSNPYYEPRKRAFPDLNDYCSFGAPAPRIPGKWAKEYQSTTRAPKKTPYWIPEPIIEEPDSPASSPGKRAKMLEFDEIDISPASASNVATESSPDSEDASPSHTRYKFQSDDDSDKENTLGKSRPDTPSLD